MPSRICVRCGNHRHIKGRGLCVYCYDHLYGQKALQQYPTVHELLGNPPGYCMCANPLVDRLSMWHAAQCLECGRKITDERLQQLSNDG